MPKSSGRVCGDDLLANLRQFHQANGHANTQPTRRNRFDQCLKLRRGSTSDDNSDFCRDDDGLQSPRYNKSFTNPERRVHRVLPEEDSPVHQEPIGNLAFLVLTHFRAYWRRINHFH